MSDSPLDGGSGWPTSAYAIIRRPDNYFSVNGSASTSLPNHAAPVAPTPQPIASEPRAEAPPASKPGAEAPPAPKVKLPRQKSWLRGRGWSNRDTASEQHPEVSTTEATVNLEAAAAADVQTAPAEADIASGPVDEAKAATRAEDADRAGDLAEETPDSVDTTALTSEALDTAETTAGIAIHEESGHHSGHEYAALNPKAAEETRDLREAMLSMRQPDDGTSAARGTAVVTAGPLPDEDKKDLVNDEKPTEEASTPRGLAIAAAIVIFVALALVVFFAIRANTAPDEETAPPTPTAAPAGVQPGTSTPVSFAPENGNSAPAVHGTEDVLRAGSIRLAIGTDQADESFDFDSGIKGAPNAFAGEQQPDLDALTQGLWAANGAHVAVWSKPTAPTEADCRALPDSDWTSLVKLEPVLVGPKVCVQTSEGRAATFIARPINVGPDGGVQTVYLDFTVWKKAGD